MPKINKQKRLSIRPYRKNIGAYQTILEFFKDNIKFSLVCMVIIIAIGAITLISLFWIHSGNIISQDTYIGPPKSNKE